MEVSRLHSRRERRLRKCVAIQLLQDSNQKSFNSKFCKFSTGRCASRDINGEADLIELIVAIFVFIVLLRPKSSIEKQTQGINQIKSGFPIL